MAAVIGGAMVGSALIGGAGAMLSGDQSARAAERNYKHRYQWQMQDMRKAGLNPMLAFQHAAPNVPQPTFPNVGEAAAEAGTKAGSVTSAAKLQRAQETNLAFDSNLKNSQAAAADASARAADANAAAVTQDTQIKAATLPYSAANASAQYRQLDALARQANNTADRIAEEVLIKKQERVQNEDLMPLAVEYQRYMVEAAKLGIPEKQADADFWKTVGQGGKWAGKIKDMVPNIGHIGPKVFKRR